MVEIPPHVAERLDREHVIWLTTTSQDGTPLPNPVWFYWDGKEFLVFTEPGSVKMRNMSRNPRVALNLNCDFDGDQVAIFQAMADVNPKPATDEERSVYLAKYEEGLKHVGMTADVLWATFRLVRLRPSKYRTPAAPETH